MLSYYDSLSFSLRKQSFLVGFGIALVMLAFFLSVGISLENQYAIFSNYRDLLQSTFEMDKVRRAFNVSVASGKMVTAMTDPSFISIIVSKLLSGSILLLF